MLPSNSTPATPFILTRGTRYTPPWVSSNGDATLGTGPGAVAHGSYAIIGRIVLLQFYYGFGVGGSGGTGAIHLPLPSDFALTDWDISQMCGVTGPTPPDDEGVSICPCFGVVNGINTVFGTNLEIAFTGGSTFEQWNLEQTSTVQSVLKEGDSIFGIATMYLKERALPG